MIKEKNIAVCIFFTLITCGIYGLFWMVSITEDIDIISKNPNRRNGAMVIVFSLLTCGIYSFYWWYQNGKLLEETNQQTNIASSGNAVPRKGETINDVLINLINSYKKASKAQGMIIDEAKSMYRLDVSAIDVELADYHVSDKSYSKIVGTDTMGTSTNTMLSRTDGSVVTSKTKAIRIANENSGLLSNMKASLDTAAVQMLVQKTDIDASVLTMNKKYTIKADDVYRSSDYNGTWLLIRKRELYIREDNNFTMSTMLLFEKI